MANEVWLIDAYAWKSFYEDKKNILDRFFTRDAGYEDALDDVDDWMDAQPTVDAVPVVHGRWEKAEYKGFVRCDQCKDVYINEEWLMDGKWNNCPNCGAKMDGDGNG